MIAVIQIQHLLKLNATFVEATKLEHTIQIQHLLKLNLINSKKMAD